jgi:signal transduction histidine kinase
MNAILGFSNMLIAEEVPKAERDKYLQLITKNGQTLLHLINDMIKLARIESGQIEVKKQFFSVNNLMVDLHRQFIYEKEQRGRKHLLLNISTGNDNPQFSIYSDGNKIRDIMENLLDNAVKFTHEGEIEFGYRLLEQNNIEFFVRDTGIGIPVEMHKDIFRRFHQLDNSLTREYGGTGIGLSVAQDFVDKLGSRLEVSSESGKGSKFFFVIPIEAGNGFLRVV